MSKMDRGKSPVEASRLYRQASEHSDYILNSIGTAQSLLGHAVREVSQRRTIRIYNLDDSRKWLNRARKVEMDVANSIDPRIAIPSLVELVDKIYYVGEKRQMLWLGAATKRAIALLWNGVLKHRIGRTNSTKAVARLLGLCYLNTQLNSLEMLYENFTTGEASLSDLGLKASSEMGFWLEEMNDAYSKRGMLHRTLDSSGRSLLLRGDECILSIPKILAGSPPADFPVFKDTLFAEVPASEHPGFWNGLLARLVMMRIAIYSRAQVTEDQFGLALIGDVMTVMRGKIPQQALKEALQHCFWQKDWYQTRFRNNYDLHNTFVDRPALRISYEPNLYVTTTWAIADSINWFVEASVLAYSHAGGEKVSESIFNHFIAENFEDNAAQELRKWGFRAGHVTENGYWEGSGESLRHSQGDACPGEIDVLAVNADNRLVIIGECKVLALPDSPSRMRNILSKINDVDDSNFHKKLNKKLQWIKGVEPFSALESNNFRTILILDRKFPGLNHLNAAIQARGEAHLANTILYFGDLGEYVKWLVTVTSDS